MVDGEGHRGGRQDRLSSWLKVLGDDSRAVFKASSLAQRAADFILAFRPMLDEVLVEPS